MRIFAETLRTRVGAPLSISFIERDMAVSPKKLLSHLDILEALFLVFAGRYNNHYKPARAFHNR